MKEASHRVRRSQEEWGRWRTSRAGEEPGERVSERDKVPGRERSAFKCCRGEGDGQREDTQRDDL